MQKYTFSSNEAAAFLRFLTTLRKVCDESGVSEPNALKILPYFLSGNARALFDHMTEDARSNVGGFSDYPNAVKFFFARMKKMSTWKKPENSL